MGAELNTNATSIGRHHTRMYITTIRCSIRGGLQRSVQPCVLRFAKCRRHMKMCMYDYATTATTTTTTKRKMKAITTRTQSQKHSNKWDECTPLIQVSNHDETRLESHFLIKSAE